MELKPCPFCGGRAFVFQSGNGIWVQCYDCLCGTSVHSPHPDMPSLPHTVDECAERAVTEWNRRDGACDAD